MKNILLVALLLAVAPSFAFASKAKLKGPYKMQYVCSVGGEKALHVGLHADDPGKADVKSTSMNEAFEDCDIIAGKRGHLAINCSAQDEGKTAGLSLDFDEDSGKGTFRMLVDGLESGSFPMSCKEAKKKK